MRLWVLSAVIFASAPAFADDPLAGSTLCMDDPTLCLKGRIVGVIKDKATGDAALGATVVATSPTMTGEQVVITDEHGGYALEVPDGVFTLTIYYDNVTFSRSNVLVAGSREIVIPITIDSSLAKRDAEPYDPGYSRSPELSSVPRFGLSLPERQAPIARDRTHRAWIAPVAGADPVTSVTTLDGGVRLAGAPGIPRAFLDNVETSTVRTPIAAATGTGGATELVLRYGSNQTHANLQLLGEVDGDVATTSLEVFAGGPLKKDRVWLSLGFAGSRPSTAPEDAPTVASHVLAQLSYMPKVEHVITLVGMQQTLLGVQDGWAQFHSRSRLEETRLQIDVLGTAEKLDYTLVPPGAVATTPLDTARAGADVIARLRVRAAGYHQFQAMVGGGVGTRGDREHADGHLGIGDIWQVRPNVEIGAGVRIDDRTFDGTTAEMVSSRLYISHDHTREGRADTFVAYQRVPHFDDGQPGDWLAATSRYHDEIAAGASFSPVEDKPLMLGVAGRTRFLPGWDEPRMGVEAWVRYETDQTLVLASATTFDDVVTLLARRALVKKRRHELAVAGSARTSSAVEDTMFVVRYPRDTLAGGVLYRYKPTRRLAVDATFEGFGGTDGGGARAVVGSSF